MEFRRRRIKQNRNRKTKAIQEKNNRLSKTKFDRAEYKTHSTWRRKSNWQGNAWTNTAKRKIFRSIRIRSKKSIKIGS